MTACEIKASDIIAHVRSRRKGGVGPSTANNDVVWLRVILRYARAAWDLPFDLSVIDNAFRQACKLLEIHDPRFHDLRHEATSRLFEAGYSIVEVQQFTLHDSWGTLSRHTHLRPEHIAVRTTAPDQILRP